MDLRISPAKSNDELFSCNLTKINMAPYYKHYGIEWSNENFLNEWKSLDSYIIYSADTAIGFISLSYSNSHLYIRDIQIIAEHVKKELALGHYIKPPQLQPAEAAVQFA